MGGAVLLGMPGPWADDHREPSDPYTTKIGGLPDWPIPINGDLLRCRGCDCTLCLVAQVYAPLSSSQHRALFILGCLSPKCGARWRVLRVQKVACDVESSQHSEVQLQNGELCEDVDEDGGEMDLAQLGKALFEAGTLAASNGKSKKPRRRRQHKSSAADPPCTAAAATLVCDDNHIDMPVVPCFYMYTQEEPSTGDLSSVCSNYASLSIKENKSDVEDHSEPEEAWEKERYEYDKALTADRMYLKFKKRLDAYPEQCFRYAYGGKPILAAADDINPGSCTLCGRPRQFEMQLMPPLLYFLQEAVDEDQRHMLENWDWMTLIVYTCSESCCEETELAKSDSKGWIVAEEAVVAQNEESLPIQLGYFS